MLSLFAVLGQAIAPAAVQGAPPAARAWTRRPTGEDVARYYPERASTLGLEGRVVLVCLGDAKGGLRDCTTEEETPAGEGFAAAALKLAPIFQMTAKTNAAQSDAREPVRIPIRFTMPDFRAARSYNARFEIAAACYGQVAHREYSDPPPADVWRSTAYWSMQTLIAASQRGLRPLAYEQALTTRHAEAAAGTLKPPPGADLATCLAEAAKR